MKSLEYITDMSKCQDAGLWGMDYNIFRFMLKKHIAHLTACCWPLLVCDVLLGTPVFLKLAYAAVHPIEYAPTFVALCVFVVTSLFLNQFIWYINP